eukprot:sb/3470996/
MRYKLTKTLLFQIEREKVIDITTSPEKPKQEVLDEEMESVIAEEVEPPVLTEVEPEKTKKNVVKQFKEKKEEILKDREKEIIEIEKSHLILTHTQPLRKDAMTRKKEGAVIGSMERGPRMFGVRYGPCDRPKIDDEFMSRKLKDVKKQASIKHSTNPCFTFEPDDLICMWYGAGCRITGYIPNYCLSHFTALM